MNWRFYKKRICFLVVIIVGFFLLSFLLPGTAAAQESVDTCTQRVEEYENWYFGHCLNRRNPFAVVADGYVDCRQSDGPAMSRKSSGYNCVDCVTGAVRDFDSIPAGDYVCLPYCRILEEQPNNSAPEGFCMCFYEDFGLCPSGDGGPGPEPFREVPRCSLTAVLDEGTAGEDVIAFKMTAGTDDYDTPISRWQLDYDDGATDGGDADPDGQTRNHIYNTAGNYRAALTVWDEDGDSFFCFNQVGIAPPAPTGLSHTNTPASIRWSWNVVAGADYYRIYTQSYDYPNNSKLDYLEFTSANITRANPPFPMQSPVVPPFFLQTHFASRPWGWPATGIDFQGFAWNMRNNIGVSACSNDGPCSSMTRAEAATSIEKPNDISCSNETGQGFVVSVDSTERPLRPANKRFSYMNIGGSAASDNTAVDMMVIGGPARGWTTIRPLLFNVYGRPSPWSVSGLSPGTTYQVCAQSRNQDADPSGIGDYRPRGIDNCGPLARIGDWCCLECITKGVPPPLPPPPGPTLENCFDGIDNDGDSDIDCQDAECFALACPGCRQSTCDDTGAGRTYQWQCVPIADPFNLQRWCYESLPGPDNGEVCVSDFGDNACCDEADDCVYSGACYDTDTVMSKAQSGLLEPAYCDDDGWNDCDVSRRICRQECGFIWGLAGVSSSLPGEYDNFVNSECCGDDNGEQQARDCDSGNLINVCCSPVRPFVSEGRCVDVCNASPTADNLEVLAGNYCNPPVPIQFSWRFLDPDLGDRQSAFRLQVDKEGSFAAFGNGEVDVSGGSGDGKVVLVVSNPGINQLGYGRTYRWRLKVWDDASPQKDSGWIRGPNFRTPTHMYPVPRFTFYPEEPTLEEVVEITDTSICYTSTNTPYNCQEQGSNKYQWSFGSLSAPFTSSVRGDTTVTFQACADPAECPECPCPDPRDDKIELEITDQTIPGSCQWGESVTGVQHGLPWWGEVSP